MSFHLFMHLQNEREETLIQTQKEERKEGREGGREGGRRERKIHWKYINKAAYKSPEKKFYLVFISLLNNLVGSVPLKQSTENTLSYH